MLRYPALIDGKNGAYGVTFPTFPALSPWEKPLTRHY